MTQNGAQSYEDVQINIRNLIGAIWNALPRIFLITAILCALTFVSFSFINKEYASSASVLLEPRNDNFTDATGTRSGGASQSSVDNAAIASQIQLLKSRETLINVIDDLDLRSNSEFVGSSASPLDLVFALFGSSSSSVTSVTKLDDKIVGKLTKNLTAAQVRDSRVIAIKYKSGSSQLSADVANSLAKALVNRRSSLSSEDTTDASRWLEQEISRLSASVVDAENKVANFRVENDLFSSSTRETTLIGQQLSDLSRQISTVSERKNSAATRARLIRDILKAGQSLDSVPDVRQSPIIQRMSEQKANFQASRAQSAATLLDNHPTLQALDAQIADIDRQIKLEGRRIAESLDTQAKIEGELEKSLLDELARLKLTASGAERSGVSLAELEREAEAKRNLLNTFLARQNEATARTNSGAVFPDVRIISTASAPSKAAWPNKPLLLILVGGISVVLQLGMVIVGELAAGNVITVRPELRTDEEQSAVEADAEVEEPLAVEPAVVNEADVALQVPQEVPMLARAPVAQPERAQSQLQSATGIAQSNLNSFANQFAADEQSFILIASNNDVRSDSVVADDLMKQLSSLGKSVVVVNAGGSDHVTMSGLTDMCAGEVEFGSIIHKGSDEGQYFVPWGTKARLKFSTERFELMMDALDAIYDHVIVECGQVGMRSPISAFSEMGAVAVVTGQVMDQRQFQEITQDFMAVGIDDVELFISDNQQINVA